MSEAAAGVDCGSSVEANFAVSAQDVDLKVSIRRLTSRYRIVPFLKQSCSLL